MARAEYIWVAMIRGGGKIPVGVFTVRRALVNWLSTYTRAVDIYRFRDTQYELAWTDVTDDVYRDMWLMYATP